MSPVDRAYGECRGCGPGDEEIDRLIGIMTRSPRDRATLLKSFDATFEPGDTHRELCLPCAEAVLDVGGKKRRSDEETERRSD